MADAITVFDPNVFNFSYSSLSGPPVLLKASTSARKAQRGQSVSITVTIVEKTTTPGRVYPLSLPTPPQIEIFNPSNQSILSPTNMTEIDPGIYTYIITTDTSDTVGPYSAVFTATLNTTDMVSSKNIVFDLN